MYDFNDINKDEYDMIVLALERDAEDYKNFATNQSIAYDMRTYHIRRHNQIINLLSRLNQGKEYTTL